MASDLNLSAYYYAFEPTGTRAVDLMLSAVARAGKAFHHTEDWGNEIEPYHSEFEGKAPVDWIQNAAIRAAVRISELEAALQGIVADDDAGVSLADQRARWNDRMAAARTALERK